VIGSGIWLSQCSLSLVCSVSSCVGLLLLYDTLVQLFNSSWEDFFFVTEQVNYLVYVETNTPKYSFLLPY
jgi:hypothetical protein